MVEWKVHTDDMTYKPAWNNFVRVTDQDCRKLGIEYPVDVMEYRDNLLRTKHNATSKNIFLKIVFNTEEDLTMFLLRWS